MQTRRLVVADWQANRAIRLRALAENPGLYFTTLAEAEARSEDQWRAMLTDPSLAVFGLFDREALAGITAAYLDPADPHGRTAALAMSYLLPEHRGRGLTARLYPPRLDWARAQGAVLMKATARACNTPSRRAIERHGFRETGRAPHHWPDGTSEEVVHYQRAL